MKKSVLLVDDSSFMRAMLTDELDSDKFFVISEAEDGFNAIEKYKKYNPDIVLMDITMPKLSGIEALKEIMQLDYQANVIMCSALGSQYSVCEALQSGAKDFVVKPFFRGLNKILSNL